MPDLTPRQQFINEVDAAITLLNLSEVAAAYWEEFKKGKASTGELTEMGQNILNFMKENNIIESCPMSAKSIGEGLFIASRVISGAMRKLVKDGFVDKIPGNPVTYYLHNTAEN